MFGYGLTFVWGWAVFIFFSLSFLFLFLEAMTFCVIKWTKKKSFVGFSSTLNGNELDH